MTNVTFGCRGYHQSGVIHEFTRKTEYNLSPATVKKMRSTVDELREFVGKLYKGEASGVALTVNSTLINPAHYSAIEFILEEDNGY